MILCFSEVRGKKCQRCLTIRYTAQWGNHMAVGARTKTISRGTTSYFQIPCLRSPEEQKETTAARYPPHATAPSPALRPKPSLQPPSPLNPQCTRNRWCPRAPKVGWHPTGLQCPASCVRVCLNPKPPNPETTEKAPNCPSKTDHLHDLDSHNLTKTVSVSVTASRIKLLTRQIITNLTMQTLCLFFSVRWSCQDWPLCEVRPGCSSDCTASCTSAFWKTWKLLREKASVSHFPAEFST